MAKLERVAAEIRACRICRDQPHDGRAASRRASQSVPQSLPHEPRPVLQVSSSARLAICGQAPGTRVHASGRPFTDPSGDRLRAWMGIAPDVFYDASRVAIVPMGFCFPGLDAKGSDLPPRSECAATWHRRLFEALPQLELVLLVGFYAQRWHLGDQCRASLTETVADWRAVMAQAHANQVHVHRRYMPLPHPSWRNSGWIKRHPWFEADLLPVLQREVAAKI